MNTEADKFASESIYSNKWAGDLKKSSVLMSFFMVAFVLFFAVSMTGCGGQIKKKDASAGVIEEYAVKDAPDELGKSTGTLTHNNSGTLSTENDSDVSNIGILLGIFRDFQYPQDVSQPGFSVTVESPLVSLEDEYSSRYPKLQESLRSFSSELLSKSLKSRDEMLSEGKKWFSSGEAGNGYSYENEEGRAVEMSYLARGTLLRADRLIFSLEVETISYAGGAHPYLEYSVANFDSQTGKALLLQDITESTEGLARIILAHLYSENEGLAEAADEIEEYFYADGAVVAKYDDMVWGMGYDSLNVYFGDYALGSYALGSHRVIIPFEELDGIVKGEYISGSPAYLIPLPEYGDTYVSGGTEDGKLLSVHLTRGYSDEDYPVKSYRVNWGESYLDIPVDCYNVHPVLVRRSKDRYYLLVETVMDDEYRETTVIDLPMAEGRDPVVTDNVDGYMSYDIRPVSFFGEEGKNLPDGASGYCALRDYSAVVDSFKIYSRTDILGTADGYRVYTLDEKGFRTEDEFFLYDVDELHYESLIDIYCDVVDEKSREIIGKDVLIPAGTDFISYRSDNKTYMEFRLLDDRIVRLETGRDENGNETVNGINATEVFGELRYAG